MSRQDIHQQKANVQIVPVITSVFRTALSLPMYTHNSFEGIKHPLSNDGKHKLTDRELIRFGKD